MTPACAVGLRDILGHLRRADNEFGLIENGDKIAIGLSGGKDSLVLSAALCEYKKWGIKDFELVAISIDCAGGTDFSKVGEFCEGLGLRHEIVQSEIFNVIFNVRKEKSPCSLCAKMRRGILNAEAKKLGCNKVALGHHADDMIETFFLNLLYTGRMETFKAKSYMDRTDITTIRPLVFVTEAETIRASRGMPILENCCAVNHKTKREDMKNLVKRFEREIPGARGRLGRAIGGLL
jgi:tRNA(Ile)-lysidine synthase TilS/MesJ